MWSSLELFTKHTCEPKYLQSLFPQGCDHFIIEYEIHILAFTFSNPHETRIIDLSCQSIVNDIYIHVKLDSIWFMGPTWLWTRCFYHYAARLCALVCVRKCVSALVSPTNRMRRKIKTIRKFIILPTSLFLFCCQDSMTREHYISIQ